jgi:hypothetical protein
MFSPRDSGKCRITRQPFLVFHPQLNPKPFDVPFKRYRGEIFDQTDDQTEIITLNWARGFTIPALQQGPCSYGGSAIYMKSVKFELADTRIDTNHKRGLYYTNWHVHRSHLSFLNYDEHVFYFRMQKVHTNPGVLYNRTGPEMLSVWKWNSEGGCWVDCGQADDGFQRFCAAPEEGSFNCCLDASLIGARAITYVSTLAGSTSLTLTPHTNFQQVNRAKKSRPPYIRFSWVNRRTPLR